jgi:hypothetical protein
MSKRSIPKKDTTKAKSEKKKYKVRNWSEYNKELVRRGSLDFWVEQGLIKDWNVTIEPEKRKKGAQPIYSGHAIETTLLIGKVYHQRLRQTEGLVKTLFKQTGIGVSVPNYSTLSRRGDVEVELPKQEKEAVAVLLDSTGLKVYGEGEWKVRKHGYSKRRKWVKLHISIDTDGEIRAARITDNSVDDATAGVAIIKEQHGKGDRIKDTYADGAYDKKKIYDSCIQNQIKNIHVPPRKDAKIWIHGNRKGDPHPRDENLRGIRKSTRKRWKETSGYHRRSLVENTMYRRKTIFGDTVHARKTENQIAEVMITLKALNIMTYNGMPDSYPVA